MVNFGGYLLPVQYADQGIVASHLHTRRFASIFDVSHMLQTNIRGKAAIECFESICTADIRDSMFNGSSCLTIFTDDQGYILDDLIVSRVSDNFLHVVSNAAMREQDMAIMNAAVNKYKAEGKDISIEFLTPTDRSLIAIQGPKAAMALNSIAKLSVAKLIPVKDLTKLKFMQTTSAKVAGVPDCRITRCGYTGEDGFEISIPSNKVIHVTENLLATNDIKLAGLGARDSLRLEAGLCLYGTDIDNTTTPVEAALSWLIAKRRRTELNFPGAQKIMEQLNNGASRHRIGLRMIGSCASSENLSENHSMQESKDNARMNSVPPARSGAEIYHNNTLVGHVTSGCPSPTLGENIAMGYVTPELNEFNTRFDLKVRGKLYPAEIAYMPFIQTRYFTHIRSC